MKIGHVSQQTGLGIHTIRYYEKQELIKKPVKDSSGHRSYNIEDVDVLNWISCMKNSGMSLSKIKTYTDALYGDQRDICVVLLEVHLNKLKDQKQEIDHYIEVTKNKIDRLKKALT